MPLLNVYGEYDHLVPPEACRLLTQQVGSGDHEDICLDTGHIGFYVSAKYQKELFPRMGGWLRERDSQGTPRPSKNT
jgi:polyhydroxyalkanoate synthase